MANDYNGWANWETWDTNVWFNHFDGMSFSSADEIEAYVTQALNVDDMKGGLAKDFVIMSLEEVNWEEIYEALLND